MYKLHMITIFLDNLDFLGDIENLRQFVCEF